MSENSPNINALEGCRLAVFGGAGGWGTRVVKASEESGAIVQVVEKDAADDEVLSAAENNDAIFLATPDQDILSILEQIRPKLSKQTAVLDCATNKSSFQEILFALASAGISVCSTHPLVKPQTNPRGQNLLTMPVGEHAERAMNIARSIFEHRMGMLATTMDLGGHGDKMAISQFIPHLFQRLMIAVLGPTLKEKDLTMHGLADIATANSILTEIAMGRVGVQEPIVSAGILAEALRGQSGAAILDQLESAIRTIREIGDNREALAKLFQTHIDQLDPDSSWREKMMRKTEIVTVRLGNLRKRSFTVGTEDRQAILLDILEILSRKHGVNMNAMDSMITYDDDGPNMVEFDIGVTDEEVNLKDLAKDLEEVGAELAA